jgi:hypothetical protein
VLKIYRLKALFNIHSHTFIACGLSPCKTPIRRLNRDYLIELQPDIAHLQSLN